jgi:RNA polymerase-binding transcription factor DksA
MTENEDLNQHEPDVLDRAAQLSQRLNDAYVKDAMRKAAPEQVQRADGSWPQPECIDCDIEIPQARLQLGRIRCVDCQQALESSKRFHR